MQPPQLPITHALPQAKSHEQLSDAASSALDALVGPEASSSSIDGAAATVAAGGAPIQGRGQAGASIRLPPGSVLQGPASVDSPPAPRGIWGNGLHQQRLTNLASDLASVRLAPPGIRTHAAEAPAAVSYVRSRKDSSSSRSAGSIPHAGEAYRARGSFPFDSSAAFKQQQR